MICDALGFHPLANLMRARIRNAMPRGLESGNDLIARV
jgi:hypothetical protein